MKLLVVILCFVSFSVKASGLLPKDSVGLSKVKNQTVIIHKVDKGEGLLSIARRYNTTIDEIKKLNKGIQTVKVGQKIKIPYTPGNNAKAQIDSSKITIDESHANADAKEVSYNKTYKVQQGETLAKVAAKFKTTPQLLIKWNGIKNNSITPGQTLIVSGVTAVKPYEKWNSYNSISEKPDTLQNLTSTTINQIEEDGFVALTTKVTHPTLSKGSFVLCVNPVNNQQIILQIEQTLPLPNNCIIGLPQNEFNKLNIQTENQNISIKYNQ